VPHLPLSAPPVNSQHWKFELDVCPRWDDIASNIVPAGHYVAAIMPNFSRATLLRIGRLLNPGRTGGHLARLAECAGTTRKAISNWVVEVDDPQYRTMPSGAKRVVTLLAYFALTGQLTRETMEDIVVLEGALEDEGRFADIAAQVSAIIHDGEDQL